ESCDFIRETVTIVPGEEPCGPVGSVCGPLSFFGPSADTTCPGEPLSVTFTVENQGEPNVDVYFRTSSTGWTLSPTFINNLDTGTRQVIATRTNPSSTTQQLVVRATSYLATTTPADTSGESCDFVRETVTIVPGEEPCGPVGSVCGPLSFIAPPADTVCPGEPVQFTVTVENQGEPAIDVYLRTASSGWTFSSPVINNLASGATRQITVSRSTVPTSPLELTLRATSYLATSTPADTSGDACDFVREVVNIVIGPCEDLAQVCPRTIGFWRQQTQQKANGSRKICSDDPSDPTDMQRLWENVIQMTDLTSFRGNDGSTISVSDLQKLEGDDLFDALGCELEGPRPMTQRNMAEIQYLALLLNVSMGLIDLDTPVTIGEAGRTVGDAIDEIEEILNRSNSTNVQLGTAGTLAECINSGSCIRGIPCEGGENGPFAGFGRTCPSGNVGFVCQNGDDDDDDDDDHGNNGKSDHRVGPVPAGQLALSAYPNPFNPTAILRWSVGSDLVGQPAVIDVFDAAGRPVAHLFDGVVSSESNEVLLAPDSWSSGMYIARLTVGNKSIVYRLMLVK
ncbi:MAG TPA: T9SS type A sorting domain-containing protein, partial [Candidatus Eisenbacteria bacterium]